MKGILDDTPTGVLDPRSMALMQMGMGLMASSGPSPTPVSFGQNLGQAGMQGMQAFQQAQAANQQQQLFNMKLAEAKRMETERRVKEAAMAELVKDPRFAGMGPLLRVAPQQAIERAFPKDNKPVVVGPGAALVDPEKPDKPLFTAPAKPAEGSALSKLIAERDALPAGDPRRATYEAAITKATTEKPLVEVKNFTPASEEAQKDFMKGLRTRYDQLQSAPVALKNIEEAKALVPQAKGFMGPGGEGLMEAAKFLNNRLGTSIYTEGIKSAEELRTRIFFQIMDNLKKMDAQPSQYQQQIMMDSLGKLGTDPDALPAILDAYADTIRGKVATHNKEAADAEKRGVKFPYNPIIELRETTRTEAPKPVSPSVPEKGQVVDGWEFLGGDPGNRMNWRKAK